jgi:hypothetical protein
MSRWHLIALACALLVALGCAPSARAAAEFGIERYALTASDEGGAADTQAGSHPYELTAEVSFEQTTGLLRDLQIELPPGVILDPYVVPAASQCSVPDFAAKRCANSTAVGVATVSAGGNVDRVAVYELEPAPEEPLRLGFQVGQFPLFVDSSLRQGDDGMTLSVGRVFELLAPTAIKLTLWGDPGDPSHDALRGRCATGEETSCPVPASPAAFVTLPTSCAGGPDTTTTALADSWQEPATWLSDAIPFPQMTACQRLSFAPTLRVVPTSSQVDAPSGYQLQLSLPQNADPDGLASAQPQYASVTLPAGTSLSLSSMNGASVCETAQFARNVPPICPASSFLGRVTIYTPLLADPLEGRVILATPNANTLGALVPLYLVAEAPMSGLRIELAGQLALSPTTGQPTLSLEDMPQLPISEIGLQFYGGARALFANPPTCGPATSTAHLAPWSSAGEAISISAFETTWEGIDAACPTPPPFEPTFAAGTTNLTAGNSSPFTLTITRGDDQQYLSGLQVRLPPELRWMLAGVPLCQEPGAQAGTCPQASQLGTALVKVGAGPEPASFAGALYLTGGYGMGQYGLSIALDATAGPLDLGTVVIRGAIDEDPSSGALTITSQDLPQIVDGVPLLAQALELNIDRPGFVLNPTSCAPTQITATIEGADGTSVQVSEPFAPTGCQTPPIEGSPGHGVLPSKSTHALISHIHAKLIDGRLQLTFTTPIAGTVTITGRGVVGYEKKLRAGVHRVRLTLSRRGVFDRRRHRSLKLELALEAGGGADRTEVVFEFR